MPTAQNTRFYGNFAVMVTKKKKFKSHMMYKGSKTVRANTMKKHLELKKKGYGHTKPKKKK